MANKTVLSILKILDKHHNGYLGAKEISKQLKYHGVELTERTVRYHLKIMDERGLTSVYGKFGRKITDKGRTELSESMVSDKIGFVISKIEALSYLADFDLDNNIGSIVLNASFFPRNQLQAALKVMKKVFASPYAMSQRVALFEKSNMELQFDIPEGKVGLGTICSVTANAIFLKAAIPVTSKYGGILQIEDGNPSRFTSLISYDGTSLDPHEIFIKSNMTNVCGAIQEGCGNVLASFREIPAVCVDKAREIDRKMRSRGMGGILMIGNPNQSLLEVPVGIDKAGIIVVGGLNPVAALEEANIPTQSKATSMLYSFQSLIEFQSLAKA